MTRMARHVALVLLASAATYGYAQGLLPTDWPTKLRDAANTSSTPVLPSDTMTPAWQIPTPALENSQVYLTRRNGEPLVVLVSGNNIYQALDGTWLNSLPYQARYGYAAITTTTIDGQSTDVLLNGDGSHFDAYNLGDLLNDDPDDDDPIWSLDIPIDPERDSSFGRCWSPAARNGVFYLATYADERVFRVVAADGTVSSKNCPGVWFNDGPPAVATINGQELLFLTGQGCGLIALKADDLSLFWSRADIDSPLAQCCVDEHAGVVYVHDTVNGEWLVACDARTGDTLWSAPLDHILNEPPTLGWAKDGDGNLHAAVFVVTGGMDGEAGVYAFSRYRDDHQDQELLWSTTIPSDAWVAAVYCGCTGPDDLTEDGNLRDARLYVTTNNYGDPCLGDTYVLDAFDGEQLQLLRTNSFDSPDNPCPVIVDLGGTPYMYVLTEPGKIVAWKEGGQLPPPPVYELSVEASPSQIATNASTEVTVSLVDIAAGDQPVPVINETIQFSSNAEKNQGYVDPSSRVTDASGVATTTFYSEKRTGVVTVTARTPDGTSASTKITITKGGGEEPSASGSIEGTVYYAANGKPARKATVELRAGLDLVKSTTTNPRGKYSFQEVHFGAYTVFASANGATGMTEVDISESSPSVTADVYLE